ncbi:MAG TPA: LLM class flavin-dependent oxidoreductase [Actinomycetota bacterium]
MKIGLALPHYEFSFPDHGPLTVDRVLSYARTAERLGFDSVWVSDHLFIDLSRYGGPGGRRRSVECMSLAQAVTAATERVRVGTLVACMPFRATALMAEQANVIAAVGGGRFDLGVGAGWNQAEFEEMGIEFGTAGSRITRLGSQVAELAARLDPGVPIWIGGKGGPRVLRIVAEHAAGWNVVWQMTPQAYGERLAILARACEKAGRAPSSVALSVGLNFLIGADDRDVRARYERLQRWTPPGVIDATAFEDWREGRLAGTAHECAQRIKKFEALGVSEIILTAGHLPFAVPDDEQLERAAGELLPLVR